MDLSDNVPADSGAALTDVHFVGQQGWISACRSQDSGAIFHTTDGGATFTTTYVGTGCNSLFMLDGLQGYTCGTSGLVYRTTDGGSDWTYHGSAGQTATSIHFPPSSDTGYCCGLGGEICLVVPEGVVRMTSGTSEDLSSVWFPVTAAEGWVCGTNTILHFSGGEWRADQVFPAGNYNSLCMFNNRLGWAVGEQGLMIRTSFGDSWREMYNPDSLERAQHDVFFHTDANYGWIVGDSGLILLSIDGGRWWRIRAPGLSSEALRGVFSTGPDEVYAVGDNGTFLKYTSGGGTEETPRFEGGTPARTTVMRGVIEIDAVDGSRETADCEELLDIAGRNVMDLRPGPNDVRHVAAGVYFVGGPKTGDRKPSNVRKVVINQ
ncbi:MAG: hypothetical protein JSU73_04975 [candidate division WOR-3 bacterium]|nr:MAG: hypothetical protein JSU73_04975 [candidate division WOR-3 bacterium]